MFSIYELFDFMDVFKSLDISIGTVMKNPEMIKLGPDHLKTKKMCKHAIKKLPSLGEKCPNHELFLVRIFLYWS